MGEEKKVILLEAPTGCGKTCFAQKFLSNICLRTAKHMAIIVNRKVLKEQLERYDKEYMLENNLTVSPVKIYTYQQLEQDKSKKAIEYLENCEFVVLDEAHYLVSDVLFNPAAERSFLKLMQLVGKTCLILMTATPGDLKSLLDEYLEWWNQKCADEYSQKSEKCREEEARHIADLADGSLSGMVEAMQSYYESDLYYDRYYDPGPPPEPFSYELIEQPVHDYDHIILNCYSSQEDLVDVICNSPKRQKWLIFVDSKREGRKLKKRIERAFKDAGSDKRKVTFISSDFRKDPTMQKVIEGIVKKESYKETVLICTSVLDNGVTISDSNVQNIAINAFDEGEFKQMLGRRRVRDGERINLFICERKVSEIRKRKKREYDDFIRAFPIIGKTTCEIHAKILRKEVTWEAVEGYTFVERADRRFSKLAYWMHSKRYVRLDGMIRAMEKDGRAHVKEVCDWILKDYDTDVTYIRGVGIADEVYKDIADKIVGLPDVMPKPQYDGFVDDLNKITGKILSSKISRINSYLSQHEATNSYQFQSVKVAKRTFYYIEKDGKFPYALAADVKDPGRLKDILEKNKGIQAEAMFYRLFNAKIPGCFDDKEQVRFITICVQKWAGWFRGMCFRRQQGELKIMPCERDKEEE